VRSPETGKRIYRRKPETEWRKKEIPEQRIVSDELWKSVQERFREIRKMNGGRTRSGRVLASPYLFTGLLECSECHGNITVVSGARKGRSYRRYGFSMHAHRGNNVCTNSLLVPQPVLETRLLAGLAARVFNPTVVAYTLEGFERQLLGEIEKHAGEASAQEKKITDLERKIRNWTTAIAEGGAFQSLLDQIGFLETELQETKASLENGRPGALRIRMQDTQRFVEAKLRELQKLLNTKPRMARAEMAKHIQKRIVLTPEGKTYVAVGDRNLLGVVSYGGAGGPVCTVRATKFSLPIAA
jgi:hypothetical protein